MCYASFVVLLANFENSLLEVLHCVCGKGDGLGTVSCAFKALAINSCHCFVLIRRGCN